MEQRVKSSHSAAAWKSRHSAAAWKKVDKVMWSCATLLRCCAMSPFFHTVAPCLPVFHATAPYLLFPHGCRVYFFNDAVPCLLFHAAAICLFFTNCCTMSTISTLLHHVYSICTAAPCLLIPHCCTMSTIFSR